jgi:hypothetical protein
MTSIRKLICDMCYRISPTIPSIASMNCCPGMSPRQAQCKHIRAQPIRLMLESLSYNGSMSASAKYISLRIELLHIQPLIWRRLLVPSSISLPDLHLAIQGAMGWTDSHLHQFEIDGKSYGEPDPYGERLKSSPRKARSSLRC